MKKLLGLTFSLLAAGNLAWASGPGTTGASVLGIAVGARAIGMGEAYTAMADDVSSLYWNPAGMALLNQSAASFLYNQSYQDLNYSYASMGLSLEHGGLGGSLSYLGYGSIDGFDQSGNPTGSVKAYTGVGTFGGGLLLDAWSFGANIKAIQGQLADVSARTYAFDLGTTFVYPEPVFGGSTLRLASSIRNLGPGMTYLSQTDPLPTEWRAGASLLEMFDKKLNLSMDYGQARGVDQGSVYAGAEYWLNHFFALRLGYADSHTESNGLRAGFGMRIRDVSFDYAYASYGDLGMTHRYELTYHFGDIRPRLSPEERRILRQAKKAMREERYAEATMLMDSLIRLEPNYHMFRRLFKVALNGNEQQEKAANSRNAYSAMLPAGQAANKDASNLTEMDDLEQLLNYGQESTAMSPDSTGHKGDKR